VKEYLSENKIAFIEKDITKDPNALSELSQLGYFTTPVILIGNEAVVGFDKAKLDCLLAL
jgi:glutaredoxin 3